MFKKLSLIILFLFGNIHADVLLKNGEKVVYRVVSKVHKTLKELEKNKHQAILRVLYETIYTNDQQITSEIVSYIYITLPTFVIPKEIKTQLTYQEIIEEIYTLGFCNKSGHIYKYLVPIIKSSLIEGRIGKGCDLHWIKVSSPYNWKNYVNPLFWIVDPLVARMEENIINRVAHGGPK